MELSALNDVIDKMESLIKSSSVDNLEEIGEQLPIVFNYARELRVRYLNLERNIEKWSKERGSFFPPIVARVLDTIKKDLNELCKQIQNTDAEQFVKNGIRYKISENLIQNFQTSNLSSLRIEREKPSKVSIDGVGKFEFKNATSVDFNIERAGLRQLQDYSRVIYLESPVYWKLQSALESIEISPRFLYTKGRKRLSGVPGYFYDLARALREEYSGEIAFQELYEKLISKEVMGGRLTISEAGELSFQENERNFSLHLTAMGVVSLGILALLIERKTIDEGTFIFIDEPEAHLHPSWQVKIAKTLFELSCLGVNVVIATHSADILKFLEVEVKRNPECREHIALNHFSIKGVESYEDDFDRKIAEIKKELTDPFSELFLAGLSP